FGPEIFRAAHTFPFKFMEVKPLDWIDVRFPGRCLERPAGVAETGCPTPLNAVSTEVDVLGVIFAVEARREQAHDMHASEASIVRHLADELRLSFRLWNPFGQFGNDVAEAVDLFLSLYVGNRSARILNFLLTMHDPPDALGLRAIWVPNVN